MTTVIGGSYPSVNSDSDATINGLTVGKGGGSLSTNTVVGNGALAATNSGGFSVAVGQNAGAATTSGQIVAVGNSALFTNSTGSQNTAIGISALYSNTTGSNNVAVGTQPLFSNTTASNNTAVGYQAGYSVVTGSFNTFIGNEAGYLAAPTGTALNVAVGHQAGYRITGTANTLIGNGSGSAITSGTKNSVLGSYNGNQGGVDIRTASNNIVLSDGDGNPRLYCNSSGRWSMNGGTNNTNSVFHVYSATQDSDLQLGSTQNDNDVHLYIVRSSRTAELSTISGNLIVRNGTGGVYLSPGATAWASYSDSRLKDVTGTYTNALTDLEKLEPVKFTWKSDAENKPQVGVLAQSVQAVVPEAIDTMRINKEDETDYLGVRYTELIPLMIASIKELNAKVEAQALEIATLKGN